MPRKTRKQRKTRKIKKGGGNKNNIFLKKQANSPNRKGALPPPPSMGLTIRGYTPTVNINDPEWEEDVWEIPENRYGINKIEVGNVNRSPNLSWTNKPINNSPRSMNSRKRGRNSPNNMSNNNNNMKDPSPPKLARQFTGMNVE